MNVNKFIQKKDNNFIIKYKNKSYSFKKDNINKNNINKINILILKNKIYINLGYLLGKKIVIDFKKFEKSIIKTKIIEVTDIISKNNEYILLESFYDIIRLCKSTFYKYVNKLLIDKTLLLDDTTKTNISTYLNDNNIKDFINVIKKEIKKIDKAFITISIKNKNKVFYGEINKLNNIGDKVYIRTFTKVSLKPNKKHYKIIFNDDLPYFALDVNEKHILLPRNIILELISKDTLLAKPKKPEQFKNNKNCIIKSDLYDIKKVSLLTISKSKKHCIVENNLQKISGGGIDVGVGGLISYNLFEPYFGENTKLKVILLLGEEHINTTNCKNPDGTDELYSYIDEYNKFILKTPNNNNDIDIFIEHTFLDRVLYYEPIFLMELISNIKTYITNNHTNLKIHWTDPDIFYEDINFYNDIYLLKELYLFRSKEDIPEYNYKYIFPSLFKEIKSKDDLVNIILYNEKIKIQAEKSILRNSYKIFIKTFFANNMSFNHWFSEGIFFTQRLSMDFYVFFRIIRDTTIEEDNLIIKNVIYHAGDFHTQNIFLMFKQLCVNDKKYAINELGTDSIDGKEEKECLDFTFKTFLEKTNKTTEEPIKEPIKEPIEKIKNFIIQFDKNIKYDYLDNEKYYVPDIKEKIFIGQIQKELKNINIYFIKEITTYNDKYIEITGFIYNISIQFYNSPVIQKLINTFYIILCYHSLHTKKIKLIKLILNKFIANEDNYDKIIGFLKILNKFIKLNKNEDFKNNCQELKPLLQELQLIYEENEINTKIILFEKMQENQRIKLLEIDSDSDSDIVEYLINSQYEIKRRIIMLYYDNNYINKIMSHLNIGN